MPTLIPTAPSSPTVLARYPSVAMDLRGTSLAENRPVAADLGAGRLVDPAPADAADTLVLSAAVDLPTDLPADAGLVLVVGTGELSSSVRDLLTGHGISVDRGAASGRTPSAASTELSGAGLLPRGATPPPAPEDLLARVEPGALHSTAGLRHSGGRVVLAVGGVPVAVVIDEDCRRLVVLAVDGARDALLPLLCNAVQFAAPRREAGAPAAVTGARTADLPAWIRLRDTVSRFRPLQSADGSVPADRLAEARPLITDVVDALAELAPRFEHDAEYLGALQRDLVRWSEQDLGVPDFLDSLVTFRPELQRVDGLEHLVLFPMYTQNGNPDRNLEAVLVQVIWPDSVAQLEAGEYSNKLFVPIRFLDFTAGYDTNSAVLFPETVAMREIPQFTWGAIFADREAARFRRVVRAAADITRLELPPDAARLLADQRLAEETFVTWDLIHDRTHMHGDLPFDPFMIKQRMPYFLYTLEELRCDLTAFREAVALEQQGLPQARLVQYAILFDRIFRFAITGTRVRNYDGLGGQLLFAWLHQHHVLHWTDNRLTVDWSAVTAPVLELGRAIEDLYWRSIDRPKVAHWLAAYQLVSATVTPHPASVWARGAEALPFDGPPKGLTDAVLPDEFPLSMFYEALSRKLGDTVAATAGITGTTP
nr:DUF6421 family protein [Nakamurella alba]